MGGLRALLRCVVQDVASGSASGVVSVGETAPHVTEIEVNQLPAVVMGGGDVVGQDNRASDVLYNLTEEAAGGEEDLGGAGDDGADVAVQDRLSLIIKLHSDDEESDGEEDLYSGVATRRPDMALHQPLDWEGLCAYKRMLLTGAVAVGSRADVVDQRTMAGGHMSAGSGMIRLFN